MAELKQIAFDHESIQLAQSAIAHLQMEMRVYLHDRGELPKSLADLNLAPNWTPSSKIKSVVIDNHSVLPLRLTMPTVKARLFISQPFIKKAI